MRNHDRIIDIVADHRKVHWLNMKGPSRKRDIVSARHLAMWLIRRETNDAYEHIGRSFQGRDGNAVIYAVRAVEELVITNPEWRMEAQMLLAKLQRKAAA
jgi:chromosomal replication initiator protein